MELREEGIRDAGEYDLGKCRVITQDLSVLGAIGVIISNHRDRMVFLRLAERENTILYSILLSGDIISPVADWLPSSLDPSVHEADRIASPSASE